MGKSYLKEIKEVQLYLEKDACANCNLEIICKIEKARWKKK